MSVVEDMRKVLPDFLAPELRAVHAGFKAVDARLDAIEVKLDSRCGGIEEKWMLALIL